MQTLEKVPSKPRSAKRKIVFIFLVILILIYLGYNTSVDVNRTNLSVRSFSNGSISSLIASLVDADQSSPKLLDQIRSTTNLISPNKNLIAEAITLETQISSEITSITQAIDENPGIQQLRQLYEVYRLRMTATNDMLGCFYGLMANSGSSQSGTCLNSAANGFASADHSYRSLILFEKRPSSDVSSEWILGNSHWTQSSVYDWSVSLATELQLNGNYSLNVASWTVSPTPVRFNSNGFDILPPTNNISVSFVVVNNGSYLEQNIPIAVTVRAIGSNMQIEKRSEISLLPTGVPAYGSYQNWSSSRYLTFGPFKTAYNQSYSVSLQVGPINGQINTGVTKSVNLQVAPNFTTTT